jgi:hypothetical protein
VEIPADLHPACVPLAWLLGTWEGAGVGDYPTTQPFRFGQQVRVDYVPGKAYLTYSSAAWALADNGAIGAPMARETGYWRPQPDGEVEVLLTHPTGIVEIYLGVHAPARVELATRGVLTTETAKPYRAGKRMYGLVEGRLMWVMDMAAMGHDLQPHVSAELMPVAGAAPA